MTDSDMHVAEMR